MQNLDIILLGTTEATDLIQVGKVWFLINYENTEPTHKKVGFLFLVLVGMKKVL